MSACPLLTLSLLCNGVGCSKMAVSEPLTYLGIEPTYTVRMLILNYKILLYLWKYVNLCFGRITISYNIKTRNPNLFYPCYFKDK